MQPTKYTSEYVLRRATLEDVTFQSEWDGKTWSHQYYSKNQYAGVDAETKYAHWISFKKFVAERPKL